MKRNQKIRELAAMAVIAALYAALCYVFAFISYGPFQSRVAEILLVLIVYNKKYCIPIILGTFIANMYSPLGPIDMLLGTFATVAVCVVIILIKSGAIKKILLAPAAAVSNGVIVGLMLYYFDPDIAGLALWYLMATVAVGELIIVLAGVLAFAGVEKMNPKFINIIKNIGLENRGEKI